METGGEGGTNLRMLSKEELRMLAERQGELLERERELLERERELFKIERESFLWREQQLQLNIDRNAFFHDFKNRDKRPKSLAILEQQFNKLDYPGDKYEPALSKYTQLSTKGSISYPRTSARSRSALNAGTSDVLNMSLFRREQLADRENDFRLSRAKLSNDVIRLIVCRELFSNDNDAFNQFVASNSAMLVRIRTMFAYEESLNHTIAEETYLQPAAQLFFHSLASQLPSYTCCIPANDFELAFDAKFSEVAKGRKKGKAKKVAAEHKQETIVAAKRVQGASDLLFCVDSITTADDALWHGRALVELKTPFNVLMSEVAYAQKDQTAAEIAGFIRTREAALGVQNTVFVGALTDLFSLHLFCAEMLPSDENVEDKFSLLISDRVVDADDYVLRILYLLVIGLKKSMFDPATIMKESLQPEPMDPDYDGDDGSDGGSADDESGAEETEEGGGQSAASQAGSKKRTAIASAGGGESKRKKALGLSSVVSSALSHEEQAELELIYEDARRTRHHIACGDAIAYLGAQELETWKSLTTSERRRAPLLL